MHARGRTLETVGDHGTGGFHVSHACSVSAVGGHMTGRRNLPATLMGMFSTFTFTSADGTELLGWTNNGTGPDVVVCNGPRRTTAGLAAPARPALRLPGGGLEPPGGLGSGRPADPDRIRVEDHVADALALMAHTKVDRALLVAWSLGVNVSFEIAAEHPEKVAGMLMCAGVPGGTYDAAFSMPHGAQAVAEDDRPHGQPARVRRSAGR